jgi:hypothetical protein
MSPAEEPLTVLLRKLIDNYRSQHDIFQRFDRDEFVEEMWLIRRKKKIELPPNWVRGFYKKGKLDSLNCAGFRLSNRFPNNIAVIRDDSSVFRIGVLWVTRIQHDPQSRRTAEVFGHKFSMVSCV